jgi:hypothetical protein
MFFEAKNVSLFPRFFTNRLLSLRHSDLDKYVDIVTRENGRLLVSPKKELTSRHTEESVLTEYYLVKQE